MAVFTYPAYAQASSQGFNLHNQVRRVYGEFYERQKIIRHSKTVITTTPVPLYTALPKQQRQTI